MNILHLNTGQEGGAALCARRIHKALLHQGIASHMLVAKGPSACDGLTSRPRLVVWQSFEGQDKASSYADSILLGPRENGYIATAGLAAKR